MSIELAHARGPPRIAGTLHWYANNRGGSNASPQHQSVPLLRSAQEASPPACTSAIELHPEPTQAPAWHESFEVAGFPSLQLVPSGALGFVHVPFELLQVPTVWHWSLAVQITEVPPVQIPPWQVSPCVQALPSSHVVPSTLAP